MDAREQQRMEGRRSIYGISLEALIMYAVAQSSLAQEIRPLSAGPCLELGVVIDLVHRHDKARAVFRTI